MSPLQALHKPGVAGASDCASCVAVALELARLIVADSQIRLAAPVVFLLNGGEEAFLLGAHAFTAHSAYRTGLGAFVNLCVPLALCRPLFLSRASWQST